VAPLVAVAVALEPHLRGTRTELQIRCDHF